MDENSFKKVSKKKMVFVQIDEEITSIFDKIERLAYKEIYLVIPKRSVILQSIVNLKILKQKLDEGGKTLFVITNDPNGMKLSHQAGIKVFDHFESDEVQKDDKENNSDQSALIRPMVATSNDVDDYSPSRLPQKKSTIFEVVRNIKAGERGFSLKSYLKQRKANKANFYVPGVNKKIISAFVFGSVLVFAIISYVALPGATINIVPASAVVTKAVNINLEENTNDSNTLKAHMVESEVEYSISHHASGTKSKGVNASGILTIYNVSNKNWPLLTETRFQTELGIVFRIKEGVTVPANGELEVSVTADTLDANGIAVGERGNIGPSKFFLPGLKEDSRTQLYAESFAYMTGGTTDVSTYITEEDLIAASEKLETELEEKALSALRKEVLAKSAELGLSLALLEDSDLIQYGTAKIDLPYELLNEETESFEVGGSMTIKGVAYDSEALSSVLKSEMTSTKTPGKVLVRIDENSISINVFEVNTVRNIYKFTAQIQGIEEYEIDPELEGGAALGEKIKEHIAGKAVEEAENYIQNLPEVNSVEIKMWPIWSPTIPTLSDNIKIRSLSESEIIE